MKKLKKYGFYVLDKNLESYTLWFETVEERDKIYNKINPGKIIKKEKRQRQWYGN